MDPKAYLEMAETEAFHWWFCGRRDILRQVISRLALPANAKILEVGCGTGGNLPMLAEFGRVKAIEMDETARSIAIAKTNGSIDIRAGFCPSQIPYLGEKFDLICLFDVLEHIEEDVETLVSLKNLLADNGRILLTVPAHQWLWSTHDEFLHHKRRYSCADLTSKVKMAKLRPAKLSYFNTLLFPLVALFRIRDRLTGRSAASGTAVPSNSVNSLLYSLFKSERLLVDKFNFPFGVSLLAILDEAQQ